MSVPSCRSTVPALSSTVQAPRRASQHMPQIVAHLHGVAEILALAIVRYHQRRRRLVPMSAETSCNADTTGIGVREGGPS